MDSYQDFAYVYDEFMDNIPYDEWHSYLHELLIENNVKSGIVVDLACGTGSMTYRLAEDGYDMIGIDLSEDMLDIARDKCNADVLLLQQDMRELDLYGTAAAMVCVCDGMNYILESDDLRKVFKKVYIFLDYNGIFIFDINSYYKITEILGNNIYSFDNDDVFYCWNNTLNDDIVTMELTFFIKEDE